MNIRLLLIERISVYQSEVVWRFLSGHNSLFMMAIEDKVRDRLARWVCSRSCLSAKLSTALASQQFLRRRRRRRRCSFVLGVHLDPNRTRFAPPKKKPTVAHNERQKTLTSFSFWNSLLSIDLIRTITKTVNNCYKPWFLKWRKKVLFTFVVFSINFEWSQLILIHLFST